MARYQVFVAELVPPLTRTAKIDLVHYAKTPITCALGNGGFDVLHSA